MKELMTANDSAQKVHTRIIIANANPAFHDDMREIIQQLHPDAEVIVTRPGATLDPHSPMAEPFALREAVKSHATENGETFALPPLSARQRDVLDLVVSGDTNKGIARKLGISPSTVRVHVSAVLRLLGVSSRTAAATLVAKASMHNHA